MCPSWSDPIAGQGSAHDWLAEATLVGTFDRTDLVEVEDRFNGGTRQQSIHRFLVDGRLVDVWGSVDLDSKLRAVTSGRLCKVVYLGLEELDGGRRMKRFSVQVDESQDPVGAAAAVTAQVAQAALDGDDIPF